MSVDLEEIKESFTVDADHRDVCAPIVFNYQVQLLTGSLDLDTYFAIDDEKKLATVLLPKNMVYTKFFLLITGNIMGVSDYSSQSHSTMFVIGTEPESEPESESDI